MVLTKFVKVTKTVVTLAPTCQDDRAEPHDAGRDTHGGPSSSSLPSLRQTKFMKTKKTILKLTRVPDTAAAVTTETKSAAAVLPNRSSASRVDKFIVNPKPKTQAQKKKRWDGVCGFMDGYISSPSPPSDESDSESSSDSDPDSGNGNGPCDPTQAETEYYSPTRSPVNLTDKSHPTCDEDITPWQPSPDYTTVASDHSPTIPMPRDSIVGPSMPTVPEEGSTRHDDTPGPEAGMPVVNPDPVPTPSGLRWIRYPSPQRFGPGYPPKERRATLHRSRPLNFEDPGFDLILTYILL